MNKKSQCCNNCFLYNKKEKICEVNILHEGEKYNLQIVDPTKLCHFIENNITIDWARLWEEKNNDQTVVKIEYSDENFFGRRVEI